MTTIQEIRDALKEYDKANLERDKVRDDYDEASLLVCDHLSVVRTEFYEKAPDYIRTLLLKIDRLDKLSEDDHRHYEHQFSILKNDAEKAEQERDALRADLKWLDEECHAANWGDGKAYVTRGDDGKEFFGETLSETIRAARTSDPLLNKPGAQA